MLRVFARRVYATLFATSIILQKPYVVKIHYLFNSTSVQLRKSEGKIVFTPEILTNDVTDIFCLLCHKSNESSAVGKYTNQYRSLFSQVLPLICQIAKVKVTPANFSK